MLASDMKDWAERCSAEVDADINRMLRRCEEGHGLDTQRLMLLSQASVMAYGLEAVAMGLQTLEHAHIERELE